MELLNWLDLHNVCPSGRTFAEGKTLQEIWPACVEQRGDWLCFLLDSAFCGMGYFGHAGECVMAVKPLSRDWWDCFAKAAVEKMPAYCRRKDWFLRYHREDRQGKLDPAKWAEVWRLSAKLIDKRWKAQWEGQLMPAIEKLPEKPRATGSPQ